MSAAPVSRTPVAVVGVGALVPGATDAAGYWRIICGGRDQVTEVPASRWRWEDHYDPDPAAPDKTYARRGAFLPEVDFDPMAYGVPPTALASTDSSQLLALMVADQVLADAGGPDRVDRDRTGVVLGAAALELLPHMVGRTHRPMWHAALREHGLGEAEAHAVCDRIADRFSPWRETTFPGLLGNVVAGRVANRFDLHGINHTADAACASSLAALSTAVGELALGRADLVISGGVDTGNDVGMFLCFSKTPALSPSGDCRPFSADADGTLLGEAVVMYALKRLADAERDGDRIHAVIRGIGTSSDGRSTAIYAPLPEGQARALRRAYEDAGYGPQTVELVEAHGTGTKAGDTAELAALKEVFGETGRNDGPWCAIGSVKSQIGHTKCAAGAAGLLKAVMALHHKVLPPTVKVDRPNPAAAVPGGPFYVNTRARPWVRPAGHPRRASVSSFGFGGSNFHVTLEEYVPASGAGRAAPRHRVAPDELVLFSGASPADLVLPAGADEDRPLAALARESQASFSPAGRLRLAIVATDTADLREKHRRALALIRKRPEAAFGMPSGIRYAYGGSAPGRIGFLFPGQGAQYVGMGADTAMQVPAAQDVWDRLGGVRFEGRELHRVVFPPPAFSDAERAGQSALLAATEWAQPALAVHAVALLEVVRELGLRPDCVAGHSFGELVALHCAGVLDAPALVGLARRRGELMRDAAVTPGAMLAVAADREHVARVLAGGAYGALWEANHNAPRQVVLSGSVEAVARAEEAFGAEGVSTRRLNTSTAFHSPLVASAAEPLAAFLREVPLTEPGIEVYGNADAAPYPADPDEVRRRIAGHLASPVLFRDQIEAMYAHGVRTFVEVGAGHALSGLVGQILGDRPHAAVPLDRPGRAGGPAAALGDLSVLGVPLRLDALWTPYGASGPPEPARAPRMTVRISGGNHTDPLPPPRAPSAVAAAPEPATTERHMSTAPTGPLPEPDGVPDHRPRPPYVSEPDLQAAPMTPYVPTPAVAPDDAPWQPAADATAAPCPPVSTDVPGHGPGLCTAIDRIHRQTAEAHAACQRMLVESHVAFLRMTETSLSALLGMPASGESPPVPALPEPLPDLPAALPDVPYASLAPVPAVPPPLPSAAPPLSPVSSVPPPEPAPSAQVPLAVPDSVPAPSPDGGAVPSALSVPELEELLLSVVARLTGYPSDMLTLDMELEADLGVDSIKRVEILSAVRRRVGDLPGSDFGQLARLRTLREIVGAITATGQESGTASSDPETGPAVPEPRGDQAPVGLGAGSGTGEGAGFRGPDADGRLLSTEHERLTGTGSGAEQEPGSGPPAVRTPEPAGLTRLVPRMAVAPVSGLATAGLFDGPVVVTGEGPEGCGLAGLVAAKLAGHGVRATAAAEVPAEARAVVHLGALTASGAAEAAEEARDVHRSALRAARTVAAHAAEDAVLFVAVQDTGGDFGLGGRAAGRAWLGGVAGLVRTAAKEWPGSSCRVIDCERGDRTGEEVAEAVVRELLDGGSDPEVGLRADGTRAVPRLVPRPPESRGDGAGALTSGSVVVATGGGRGVTAAALLDLARAYRPRLVLVGRTDPGTGPDPFPSASDAAALTRLLAERADADSAASSPARIAARAREILAAREVRATVAALEAAGSPVRYVVADARDADALAAALDGVRADWGPVTGIVHGAGVLADKRIADKSDPQADLVMSAKVDGLRALLAATADDPLELICLFSSVAAVYGNPGQGDYAMANEILHQVASAEQARRPGCLVRSVAWGPWRGGMVTPSLAAHFGRSGVPLIPLERGAAAFTAELGASRDEARVVLVAGDDPAAMAPAGEPAPVQALVRADALPQLADHAPAGVPVLPVAMVLNWFAGAAVSWLPAPGGGPVVVRDLRVYRTLSLPDLEGPGHPVTVRGSRGAPGAPSAVEAELRAGEGPAHFRAVVDAGADAPAPGVWETPAGLKPLDTPDPYEGTVLFHGGRFHALRAVDGRSEHGAEAVVAGVRGMDWAPLHGPLDVAAVDGALQLALLWAEGTLGAGTLPMAVAECRVHRRGPVAADGVRCVVRGRKTHATGARCDAALIDADGAVRLELIGVELVRVPS
ncbi:SDR family NAD(P)-dependent oxidoreductase [Streptomyces sp. NPDC059783]|uniref:SDR family NAD(P)-dependent oxidoreductase n=1 Tax=Streptomyces sp. NPDC059783 TaxID=3346944 RepID=UPI0036611EE2